MKTFTKNSLIEELIKIRDLGWILNTRKGNHGSVGNTLEDLLGIEENNLPLPNAAEWELKTTRTNSTSLITLFHMEPSPKALKFVPSILLPCFGWKHKSAGEKYPENEKSFRQTINYGRCSDRGFYIDLDKKEGKICFKFDMNCIDERHEEWKKQLIKEGSVQLEPYPYWGIDDVLHKIGSKMHNCFFVTAETKKLNGYEYFKYDKILMLRSIKKETIFNCFEEKMIYIDFDARTGHNHGTKFRIKESDIKNLYNEIKEY